MPTANKTEIANLALDLLGEPYLVDFLTDTGTTAEAVRLHLDLTVESVLEGHVWSFATRCATLAAVVPTHATAILDDDPDREGSNAILLTAKTPGRAGNAISAEILKPPGQAALTVTVAGTGITIKATAASTGAHVVAALNATPASAALVTASNSGGQAGGGPVVALPRTPLNGGVVAAAYGSAFALPDDCLRLLKIDGADIDVPRHDFEIHGRALLLVEESAAPPVVHYITNQPGRLWPTTFTDAVALLLASRLAYKLTGTPQLATDLLQKHEVALGKARSKDARESRSNENHGPRQLAARSAFVRARYGKNQVPY